ncbi:MULTISPECIES: formate dehydrogenase accessory sulfurtransferase FdhD [Deinococcus]|uniref:Sulfur carrier protein FdhD n=1 Tax=Deinococcus rufus TaxID=2136097 RepID=A0ABV7ZD57_9DEIO|nr:formate dehydrogenase accessory sulfurtransferase FdhD [Deinococcus sp. AB2017081]WQE93863.1 formate dehydrogenase accessory sulfurtransferase FdhD [Deinococcus sp. AB2017081]
MRLPVWRYGGGWHGHDDAVAIEEPLELRLHTPDGPLPLGVLMRTPGDDHDLLLGWLVSEGLMPQALTLAADPENANVWHLSTPEHARLAAGARLSVSSSACGVCGSGSVERLLARAIPPEPFPVPIDPAVLADLPRRLMTVQPTFAATGGVHGAALVTLAGDLLVAREDVGRHNAVDKVVGWAHRRGVLPLSGQVLVVSSRAGFEIVQKAVTAGIGAVVSVGAATSLAVDTAAAFGVVLCGFARDGRFTVYTGAGSLATLAIVGDHPL